MQLQSRFLIGRQWRWVASWCYWRPLPGYLLYPSQTGPLLSLPRPPPICLWQPETNQMWRWVLTKVCNRKGNHPPPCNSVANLSIFFTAGLTTLPPPHFPICQFSILFCTGMSSTSKDNNQLTVVVFYAYSIIYPPIGASGCYLWCWANSFFPFHYAYSIIFHQSV